MIPHFSPRNALMFGTYWLCVVDCRYFTVMLGLAAAASCMPCHADWLNDLSLMPPVSVTMHPRNLLEVDAPVVLDVVGEAVAELDALALALALVLVVDEALDELLPQAASSRHVLAAAAAVINAVCLTVSSSGPGLPELGIAG
jgi:hypothetical protein